MVDERCCNCAKADGWDEYDQMGCKFCKDRAAGRGAFGAALVQGDPDKELAAQKERIRQDTVLKAQERADELAGKIIAEKEVQANKDAQVAADRIRRLAMEKAVREAEQIRQAAIEQATREAFAIRQANRLESDLAQNSDASLHDESVGSVLTSPKAQRRKSLIDGGHHIRNVPPVEGKADAHHRVSAFEGDTGRRMGSRFAIHNTAFQPIHLGSGASQHYGRH